MSHVLYIASNSASRARLLDQAQIKYVVISQNANERSVSVDQPFYDIVMQIAYLKMQHAAIPDGVQEGDICFVLTADTLGLSKSGRVLCKPVDRHDAIHMLDDARLGTLTATGFCLRKMQWQDGAWVVLQEIVDYDQAESVFDVPQAFIDLYLSVIPYVSVSGAVSIEGFGGQFLKTVHGSYETIVGLPMFKIRQALYDFGFYE